LDTPGAPTLRLSRSLGSAAIIPFQRRDVDRIGGLDRLGGPTILIPVLDPRTARANPARPSAGNCRPRITTAAPSATRSTSATGDVVTRTGSAASSPDEAEVAPLPATDTDRQRAIAQRSDPMKNRMRHGDTSIARSGEHTPALGALVDLASRPPTGTDRRRRQYRSVKTTS
jgi:hypothetical protein